MPLEDAWTRQSFVFNSNWFNLDWFKAIYLTLNLIRPTSVMCLYHCLRCSYFDCLKPQADRIFEKQTHLPKKNCIQTLLSRVWGRTSCSGFDLVRRWFSQNMTKLLKSRKIWVTSGHVVLIYLSIVKIYYDRLTYVLFRFILVLVNWM